MLIESAPPRGLEVVRPIHELTQSVAAASTPHDIYEAALNCLQESLGVGRSSVLLADAAGVLRFVAWRGLSDAYRRAVEGHSPWDPADPAPAPVLVEDVSLDASLDGLRPVLDAEGIAAVAFIPLVISGRLIGKFMLYYAAPHAFSEDEVMIARTVALQVAFGLDQHRAHEESASNASLIAAQRDHLNAMFEATTAGIVEIDPDARFLDVNDRFCELIGRPRDQLLGRLNWLDVTHLDDAAMTREGLGALADGANHVTFEERVVRPDGTHTWVTNSVSAIRDTSGRLLSAVAVVSDITDRRQTEQSLRESERRYRTLLEALGLAVYSTDAAGRITLYNRAAAETWGREPVIGVDEWCGSWKIFRVDGTLMPHSECPMAIALKEQRVVFDEEIVVERPDGTRRTIRPYPTPLVDSAGRLTGAVNVLVDITGLREAEQALQAALRSKDDFLGQISHELRNPVHQLAGNAELLLRRWGDLPPDIQRQSLAELRAQTVRLQRLVENMMVLSRFERGMLPAIEPHLLQRLVPETLQEFETRFPRTKVVVDLPTGLPPAETNPSTVDQVLWNLLTNAQKYGPEEGPIHLYLRSAPGFVELSVTDEGPGVPEADMASLFQPYFRSSSTPEQVAGLGLGLSVCKRLMEAHGGELWATRRPERGMEFGFRLPTVDCLD